MPYISWNDSMLVHVDEIDRQHMELVKLINLLHESLLQGEGPHVVKPVLSSLVEYVILHFSAEERLMKEKDYPDFKRHKANHDKYVATIKDFMKKYRSNTPLLAREMLLFLGEWARHHISGEDVEMAPFVRNSSRKNTALDDDKPPDQ